ncbi:MAG TPA: MFS transporter [Candidatus Nanopelagicales bacterium]|nr:MFS transporter [Candidatus Nanopelagicales bacterium]
MRLREDVLANGAIVRALGSFGAAFTASWAFTVAIGLVAFANGGALAVGVVALLRLLPAALLAPVIATYADRMPRERVLFASGVLRGVATLAMAPVLIAGGPVLVVYALAVVSEIAFTPFRASHSALLPSLCRTPDQLTSVNVARGALDSASLIIGPLVAALLIAFSGLAAVFVFAGVCGVVSALLVLRLDYERIPATATGAGGLLTEVRDGLAAVTSNAGVGMVVGLVVLQAAIRGAFTVFVVVLAIDLLGGAQSSVGVLMGAVGIGALVGSLACTLLVGSRAMSRWLGIAIVLWGLPLAVMGLLPFELVALLAAGVIGVGNALVDVTAFTLIARMTPNAVLARVFGVLESLGAVAVGLGSLVAPLLISLVGARAALVVVGAVTPLVCLLWWRRLRAVDRSVTVRTDDIMLLRRVAMLRPLPVPVLEELAHGLRREQLPAGQVLFEAGEVGDSYYVIAHGTVQVLDRDQVVRTMGEGEGFGEIALLGDTTRTMTVRAVEAVELRAISSGVFLPAVTSVSESRVLAEATARDYLDEAGGAAGRPAQPS